MRRIAPFVAVVFLLAAPPISANPAPVCYAKGPYLPRGDTPRIGSEKLRAAAERAVARLETGFEVQSDGDCTRATGESESACLKNATCFESMYIAIKEQETGYSYTIVTQHRGKHLNMAGVTEDELLASLEDDIAMVLSRPRDYEFDELESQLDKTRRLDTRDLHPDAGHLKTEKHRNTSLIKGFALGTAFLALGGAAATIATSVSASVQIDELEEKNPADIKKSAIDTGKNLFLASRVTMGITLASALTSTILFGVWFKRRQNRLRNPEKIGPVSIVATPALNRTGGLFVIKGQF